MMLYLLKSAITLALLYSCFFFFLSKETFHRFNRCMLVAIMLVSLVVPLLHFTTEHPTVINEELYQMQTFIEEDEHPVLTVPTAQVPRLTWVQVMEGAYWAGVAVMLLLTLLQVASLWRLMRGGLRHTDARGNTVVLLRGDITPFSVFRYIVMNVHDYEHHRQHILTHEQEHIRLGHTYDSLLLEAMKTFQWFNPFVWFISRDLKAVHEYEADQAVINQGIDAKQYQQLLVTKVVGMRLQPFTNNLGHGSLKKRILMMYQKKSNGWLMLKALCAIPVVALTINAFATPSETDPVENIVTTLETREVPLFSQPKPEVPINVEEPQKDGTSADLTAKDAAMPQEAVQGEEEAPTILTDAAAATPPDDDPDEVFEICEEPAQYVGGEGAFMELLTKNVRYPAVASEHGIQGRVIVSFVVGKDGSCSDFKVKENTGKPSEGITVIAHGQEKKAGTITQEDLDAGRKALEEEALRVFRLMGKWEPAKQRGRVVRMRKSMPLTFRLQ